MAISKITSVVSPLPEPEALQVTFQILEGLSSMHENGFAHRDLKPRVSSLIVHLAQWMYLMLFTGPEHSRKIKASRGLVGKNRRFWH
jgi:hypothetical protein